MTIYDYIPPMANQPTHNRTIYFLVYDGFLTLDFSGPAAVFSTARTAEGNPLYTICLLSVAGGLISSESGVEMMTRSISAVKPSANDSIFLPGASGHFLADASRDAQAIDWLVAMAPGVERIASVCTGAYILAEAGLLDGRRATTHWAACPHFAERFPDIELCSQSLYTQDDNIWTSAGVTTGIDMALAMLEQDHGSELKGAVAKGLVVYAHRPGNQSQFSSLLDQQLRGGDQMSDILSWLETRLEQPTKVEQMADQAGMSERNFYRRFTGTMGMSPAKYLELRRLERARQLLQERSSVKQACHRVGFKSEAAFRTAFKNRFGLSPSLLREMHGG